MPENNLDIERVLKIHGKELLEDKSKAAGLEKRGQEMANVLALDDVGQKASYRADEWKNRLENMAEQFREEAQRLIAEYEQLAEQVGESVAKKVLENGESMIERAIHDLVEHVARPDGELDHVSAQGHLAQIVRLAKLHHGPDAHPDTVHETIVDALHAKLLQRNRDDPDRGRIYETVRRASRLPHADHQRTYVS